MIKTKVDTSQTSQKKNDDIQKIPFYKLSLQALPEIWIFQIIIYLILTIPALLLLGLIDWVAGIGGKIVTTANIKSFLFSWKFPVILVMIFLLVLVYMVIELFSQIYFTECLLKGQKAGIIKCIAAGIKSVKRFMNFGGIMTILFILIAAPLCGVGFFISLSESFYIPNFIMEVVLKNPLYKIGYFALIVFFILIAYRSIFILHAVLLDNMTPNEGRKYSSRLVKEHRAAFLKRLLLNVLAVVAIIALSGVFFEHLPGWLLGNLAETMPKNYNIDIKTIMESGAGLSDLDKKVIMYRIASVFVVILEKYLTAIVTLVCGGYLMLVLTQSYLEYSGKEGPLWPQRLKNGRYIGKVMLIIGVFILFALISIGLGVFYNSIYGRDDPVKIVAHRAGGIMASENSLEGLYKSIEHGCYAAEIDVQRTKDGYYIINHDNDFARLTGVAKTPQEMTLAEIKELTIQDTTGNGQELSVPTFEEMLDVTKGKIKLFIELKGGDHQMVDDLVRIIREHDCVEDTALVSLNYDEIDYAETNYPEFETGTLFFASLGDVSKLNCDLIVMEEESAIDINIYSIHKAGKQAMVWTVNTEEGMYKFLDSTIDGVVTDEIPMAENVQAVLDDRTDLEVIQDELVILIYE
ncbi:MAG: glycerophosphoryl diester phosphodiesterase membrane domain-containing protein [Lachnospiraceae bacterium]|nr:glycerophosphoryl diester phosphodiesterase membrane domain-containing protein [Lachnospiraceae bacterium]